MNKSISLENYEEWMIDYIEGNLSKGQEQQLLQFIKVHPELDADLEMFRQTVLQPDMQIIFSGREELKKKEEAKIIGMRSWQKYSIGIAAALLLFAGIKFININQGTTQSALKYETKSITTPVFAFEQKEVKNDTVISSDKTPALKTEQYFAEQKENKPDQPDKKQTPDTENKKINIAGDPSVLQIEFASIENIDVVKHKGRIEREVSEAYVEYAEANFKEKHSKKENKSIVDKYNSTMAFAGTMGDVLGITKRENTGNKNDDLYKETHIKIFDIEYYNRKKTDK